MRRIRIVGTGATAQTGETRSPAVLRDLAGLLAAQPIAAVIQTLWV